MFGLNKHLSWQLLASVLVAMMLTMAAPDARAASTARTASAGTDPGVQLASPAVVRILTTVSGQVIYHAPDGHTITFPLDGRSSYKVIGSGSGALISPDGYVLTADHVVDVQQDDPEIKDLFIRQAAQEYAKAVGKSIDEATQDFKQAQGGWSVPYEVTERQVFLSTNYMGALVSVNDVKSYDATDPIVKSSPEQQDVAIIKVKAETDLPYLILASASSIHVQDSVTAIAFRADAEFSHVGALTNLAQSNTTELNDLLTPSVNSGQITKEETVGGTSVYEVSGSNIADHGSSGGPVVNSQGRIIGFVDAMSSNNRVVFLRPSETVALYTKQTNMTNQTGAFMSLWTKALTERNASGACHWTQAYQDLKQLHEEYPRFGAVQSLLEEARGRATPSECSQSTTARGNWLTANWPLLAGLGAALVLLGGIGFSLFVLPRRKKATPQPAATTGTSAGGIPAGMPMGSVPAPAIRKCICGHVVTVETAHFCPECGAAVEEAREEEKESKAPVEEAREEERESKAPVGQN